MLHMVGKLKVISRPKGATIELIHEDGTKESPTEKTPFTVPNLKSGKWKVTVSVKEEPDPTVFHNWKEVEVKEGETAEVPITIFTPKIQASIDGIEWFSSGFTILLVFIAILTRLNYIIIPPDNLTRLIIYVACAGGLGGLAFSMYVLVYHVGRQEDYKPEYANSYYLRPFLGALYGIFVFFLIAGGLMALSGTSTPLSENLYSTKSFMFYIALAFLAGYAEEPFSIQLKDLAEALFKEPPADKNE